MLQRLEHRGDVANLVAVRLVAGEAGGLDQVLELGGDVLGVVGQLFALVHTGLDIGLGLAAQLERVLVDVVQLRGLDLRLVAVVADPILGLILPRLAGADAPVHPAGGVAHAHLLLVGQNFPVLAPHFRVELLQSPLVGPVGQGQEALRVGLDPHVAVGVGLRLRQCLGRHALGLDLERVLGQHVLGRHTRALGRGRVPGLE